MERAWELVRRNRGAAGIDRTTIAQIEQHGVDRLLDELAADLRAGSYHPLPARRVFIAKAGNREQRPLSIPAVCDRIVQAATKLAIESVFEADFLPCSFGFRPARSAHDALQVLVDEAWRGKRWVVETDIASCFEAIPHDRLMAAVEERIVDRHVLKLLRSMLSAGVMVDGAVRRSGAGTPQGGVISPALCNVYLHRLDRQWETRGHGVLCRYADDLVMMCKTKREAEAALAALRTLLAELGLEPKAAKTRIVYLQEGGEGMDFLGFHHRWVRARDPGCGTSRFSRAGPHGRRCSTPATVCVRSRAGTGCAGRSSRSSGTSTGSCVAGRATSATATRPSSLIRSPVTRTRAWRCGWPSAISSTGATAGRRSPPGRTASD